ncbi:hypothetical protein DENSPDRAFT_704506 [Dentipellis sp. KUC8613]|nr:hypothetical protein DENSPDRAFT_704506 [Dentipellis sp. KUC8613]
MSTLHSEWHDIEEIGTWIDQLPPAVTSSRIAAGALPALSAAAGQKGHQYEAAAQGDIHLPSQKSDSASVARLAGIGAAHASWARQAVSTSTSAVAFMFQRTCAGYLVLTFAWSGARRLENQIQRSLTILLDTGAPDIIPRRLGATWRWDVSRGRSHTYNAANRAVESV